MGGGGGGWVGGEERISLPFVFLTYQGFFFNLGLANVCGVQYFSESTEMKFDC